jgi:hypothetical protein
VERDNEEAKRERRQINTEEIWSEKRDMIHDKEE